MGTFDSKKDFIKMEHEILKFWEENQCFEKLRAKNKDNEPFRFLDGPITANNPMGIHHAWGRTIKDIFIRYKAMKGYSCHYRNGFDTQGLWVEVEVEKELGFASKKDIEDYGIDSFTKKCVERIKKFSGIITEQSKRLGQWMDWDNSYYTHTDENISGIWSFLKKCHTNGWITQSYRPMPWCPRCGTSLSEHEMSGSYKDIEHTAVFVRLPLLEKEWDILVWTTTPWTLSTNVALAVHPEIEYCLVQSGDNERPLVLARSALKSLKTKGEVLHTLKGSDLEGLHYETCFPDLPVQKGIEHKIVLWNMVSADEGSGVVHIAPGCGAEDYQLGQSLGLPAICPIDESGSFMESYNWLTACKASEVAPLVFSKLEEQVRLWFYSLLFMSVTLEGRAPYERVLAHNSVVAEDGTKFSKTGFMIKFDEAAEKLGADTIRYLFAAANVTTDVRFGFNLGEEARRKLLSFWNIYVFFMTYAMLEKPELNGAIVPESFEVTDRWLLARTEEFLYAVTDFMDSYKTADVIKAFEMYIDDVSNWYVRSNRRRFWKQEYSDNKHAAYWCLYKALKVMIQVMAPIVPFLTEYMWQNMVRIFEVDSEESVHLSNWPASIGAVREESILEQTETARKLIGMALKIRNENQLKVKQPLSCMYVVTTPENEAAINRMLDIIKDELNIKEVVFLNDCSSLNTKYLTLNFKNAGSVLKGKTQALKLCLEKATKDEMAAMVEQFQTREMVNVPGWPEAVPRGFFIENTGYKENIAVATDKDITVALDIALTGELVLEGLYRELLRQCQLLRKEAGLQVEQRIFLAIMSDSEMIRTILEKYGKNIADETLALKLLAKVDDPVIAKEVDVGGYNVMLQIGI